MNAPSSARRPSDAARSSLRISSVAAGYRIHQWVTWPAKWLREQMMKHIGVRGDIDGYRVTIDCDTELDRARVGAIVGDALERIATASPRISRRMRREVYQLLVMPEKTPAAAYFHPGTIFIPLQFFDDSDSDYVAGTIVHEATHARLETQGVRYWPHLRARIERRCFREELEFFASLPGREDLVRRCEHLVATWPVTAVKADS